MDNNSPLPFSLSILCYLLLLINITVFAAYSVLGFNTEIVINTLGSSTSFSCALIYAGWSVVYIYQLLWLPLAITLTDRPIISQLLIPTKSLGIFVLVFALQLLTNTVFILELAFVVNTINAILLSILGLFSYQTLYRNRFEVAKRNLRTEDAFVRGLFHNAIDIYALWVFYSSLSNVLYIFIRRTNPPLNPTIAFAIILAILIILYLLYIITDLTVLDKFSRYTFSPYILRLYITCYSFLYTDVIGILIILALFLAFVFCSTVAKVILVLIRRKTQPLIPYLPMT